MANRNNDHYVFQDLDLLGNDIKEVRNISSDTDKVTVESSLDIGKSNSKKNLIVTGNADITDYLVVSGVDIRWDSNTNSLVFTAPSQL